VFAAVIEDASRFFAQKTVAVDEIRALEKSLEKKPSEAIDARLLQPARELALAAEGHRVSSVHEARSRNSYLGFAHVTGANMQEACR